MATTTCYNCEAPVDLAYFSNRIKRSDECKSCFVSIHCCRMCQFYDKTAYNECSEPTAERVVDKEKSNFCDFFVLRSEEDAAKKSKEDMVSSADALFKTNKKSELTPSGRDDALDAANALFNTKKPADKSYSEKKEEQMSAAEALFKKQK